MVRKAVGKNAINENQYKSAGSGRWVVVGDGMKVEIALLKQGQIWRLPYLEDGWFERVVDKNVCVKKGSCGWGKPCFEQGQAHEVRLLAYWFGMGCFWGIGRMERGGLDCGGDVRAG